MSNLGRTPIHRYEVVGFFALALVIAGTRLVSLYRLWVPDIKNEDAFNLSPWALSIVLLAYGIAILSMHSMSRIVRATLITIMLAYAVYFGGILIRNAWAIRNARTSFSSFVPCRGLTTQQWGRVRPQIRGNSDKIIISLGLS
ncbi:MAG: hypothetical protein K1X67_11050 [Fimbriimonadaceae bacterium]|nr:hypothetical protein [Fimbriimonadaceae bacterium]